MREEEATLSDLVETLIEAAASAIRNQQTALKSPVGHVRSVTVELVLTSAGQIHEAVCYVERRTAAGAEVVTTHEGSGGVSDDVLQVTTEEQREQLHAARNHGGSCARCGRTLGD